MRTAASVRGGAAGATPGAGKRAPGSRGKSVARKVATAATSDGTDGKASGKTGRKAEHQAANQAGGTRAKSAPTPVVIRPHAPSARLADRRRKIVEAAERLFLERGFAGASVNEVVRIAGGSLATLYAEFGTKEALFEAVLSRRAAAIFESDDWQQAAAGGDAAAELRSLAARMQARILSPDGLAIFRLAVAEAPRFPGLRKTLLKTGLRGFLGHLAGYFEQLAGAGRVDIADPLLAAEHFLTLVQGQQLFIASCGHAARITAKERKAHVEQAVAAFLRIYPPLVPTNITATRRSVSAR